MSSYSGLPTTTLKNGSTNFIFIAVAIILVFVVLYYSYNFLFSNIGAPVPMAILTTARSAMTKLTSIPSFTPPYEGGDYTISFWMYVHSNNFNLGTSSYRKHIIDIGGNNFATVAIGLDANQNNLIVRTTTGTPGVSGNTSSSTTTSNSNIVNTTPGNYDSSGYLGSLSSNPLGDGSGAGACTPNGRAVGGLWDLDCNPYIGYWSTTSPGSGGSGVTTFVKYPLDSNGLVISPCSSVCDYENMGTGVTNCTKTSLGSSANSSSCTWNVPYKYQGSGSGSGSSPRTTTDNTPAASSTLACATTTILNSATMSSLFKQPVATPCTDSKLPPCDAPEYDLQRWTQITVVLSGKITDVYMNGKLARSCIGSSYFKVDTNPQVHVLAEKGFDGQLANLNLYNIALNPAQIYEIYTKGPQTK
jgi:Concanavalin A-like lectin/glucanases superfamily